MCYVFSNSVRVSRLTVTVAWIEISSRNRRSRTATVTMSFILLFKARCKNVFNFVVQDSVSDVASNVKDIGELVGVNLKGYHAIKRKDDKVEVEVVEVQDEDYDADAYDKAYADDKADDDFTEKCISWKCSLYFKCNATHCSATIKRLESYSARCTWYDKLCHSFGSSIGSDRRIILFLMVNVVSGLYTPLTFLRPNPSSTGLVRGENG